MTLSAERQPAQMSDSIPVSDLPPELLLRRITSAEYHALLAAGIFPESNDYEFIEGLLVKKMTKNRRHSLSNIRIRDHIAGVLPAEFYVDTQNPISIADSEPEPDVFVIRGKPDDYLDEQPRAEHVPFVVEIADSSLRIDRRLKLKVYAAARIPVYWLVNLTERQIEVFTEPASEGSAAKYRVQKIYRETDSVPFVLDGKEIATFRVSDLLS